MRVLELYYGTGSFSHAIRDVYPDAEIVGIDLMDLPEYSRICDKYFCIDIFLWRYMELYPPGYFNVIWASIPCQAFSVASCHHHWRKDNGVFHPVSDKSRTGLRLIELTLHIIEYFNPEYWFIENPMGLMRKMKLMEGSNRHTITYCQYGEDRMKPTDIWFKVWPCGMPVRRCKNRAPCHESTPRGSTTTGTEKIKDPIEKARIPGEFCLLLARSLTGGLTVDRGLLDWL